MSRELTANDNFAPSCASCPIRPISICGAIPDTKALSQSRRLVQYQKRQIVISEGDPATFVFNVVSGAVKLFRLSMDGRTQIIGFRLPGEFFAISGSAKYSVTVETVTDVQLCQFPQDRFKRLLREFPKLQTRLLEASYRQLAVMEDMMFLLGRKSAREKVASFLLLYGQKAAQPTFEQFGFINLPMNRTDIADFLGLTTETVSRVLANLVREKLITISTSHAIRLVDTSTLQRISGDKQLRARDAMTQPS